jgi:hypothetical protein
MKLEDRMDTLIWQLSARSDGICEGGRDSGAMDTASLQDLGVFVLRLLLRKRLSLKRR